MFRAHVPVIMRPKLHYTASGIITPNQRDAQNLFHNNFYFMPLHVSSTCALHQEVKIALRSLWYHHTETSEWFKITKIQFHKYEQIRSSKIYV
jgi:hypothetical protein